MAAETIIEYCDATWNGWRGCRKVSEDCLHCYVERGMARFPGRDNFNVVTRAAAQTWRAPGRWSQRVILACLRSDFFIEDADAWRDEAWDIIRSTPHFWLLLTKRPENVLARLPDDWPLPNVGLGVTAENERRLVERSTILKVPAALHFCSLEPQLEYINVSGYGFGWYIVGGESGPGARFFDPAWAYAVRYDSGRADVFVKQMGTAWAKANDVAKVDPKGANPAYWNEADDVKVRQVPAIVKRYSLA